MADEEKKETEDQKLEAEEVAEGFTHILRGDIDPSLPIEDEVATPPEDTDKKTPPPKEDTEEESPPAESESTKAEETPPPEDTESEGEPEELKPIKLGDKVYKSWEDVGTAYLNLEQVLGRQGSLISQQAERIAELEKRLPTVGDEDDPEPEYDVYDKESVLKWNEWYRRKVAREEKAEREKEQLTAKAKEATDFLSSHGDLTYNDMLEVDRIREERGSTLEAAFLKWKEQREEKSTMGSESKKESTNGSAAKRVSEVIDDTRKKQKEADKVGETLSGGGGDTKGGVDIDSMTPAQFDAYLKTLSPRERESVMMGEDLEA